MITEIQKGKWVVITGRKPLLYTTSNTKEIATRKYENKEGKKYLEGKNLTCIHADISVKDNNEE